MLGVCFAFFEKRRHFTSNEAWISSFSLLCLHLKVIVGKELPSLTGGLNIFCNVRSGVTRICQRQTIEVSSHCRNFRKNGSRLFCSALEKTAAVKTFRGRFGSFEVLAEHSTSASALRYFDAKICYFRKCWNLFSISKPNEQVSSHKASIFLCRMAREGLSITFPLVLCNARFSRSEHLTSHIVKFSSASGFALFCCAFEFWERSQITLVTSMCKSTKLLDGFLSSLENTFSTKLWSLTPSLLTCGGCKCNKQNKGVCLYLWSKGFGNFSCLLSNKDAQNRTGTGDRRPDSLRVDHPSRFVGRETSRVVEFDNISTLYFLCFTAFFEYVRRFQTAF